MHDFGSDIVWDLRQYFGFDYLGWLRGHVNARPDFVLSMVEGLPMESRYKVLSLPNPNHDAREMVLYQASRAHTNTLLARMIVSWAEGSSADALLPPWAQQPTEPEDDGSLSPLQKMHAAFVGGLPS